MSKKLLNCIFMKTLHRNICYRASVLSLPITSNRACFRPTLTRNCESNSWTGRVNCSSLVPRIDEEQIVIQKYAVLKSYDAEQVLNLVKQNQKVDLDHIQLAICMKRMYKSYLEVEDKNKFLEEIKSDPRFLTLVNNLLISARNLTSPIICEMVMYAQALDCPVYQLYGLMKLCTNSISDVAVDKLAELSEVLLKTMDAYEEKIKHGIIKQEDFDWLPLLANQMELLTKCISLLADYKEHQWQISDLKMRICALLAMGNKTPRLNEALKDILLTYQNSEYIPDHNIQLFPAALLCLSSYSPVSYSESMACTSVSMSWMASKVSQFKNLLVSVDGSVSDRLSKGIIVEDKYEKLSKGFEKNIIRSKEKEDSLEKQLEYDAESVTLLRDILNLCIETNAETEELVPIDKQTMKLLLGACSQFVNSNPNDDFLKHCNEMTLLVLQALHRDLISEERRGLWTISEQLEVLCSLGGMGYFSNSLSKSINENVQEVGNDDLRVILNRLLPLFTMEQVVSLADTIVTFDIYNHCLTSPNLTRKMLLDYLEENQEKYLSSQNSLDVRMKFASHMLMDGRNVKSKEDILNDLKININKFKSDSPEISSARIFLNSIQESLSSDSSREIWKHTCENISEMSHVKYDYINIMVNELWPGKVTRSSSPFHGYMIDLGNSNEENNKISLNFHWSDCFWRNTTQLKPLTYHAERSNQLQGHKVVPINMNLFDGENFKLYLKHRVERSHMFQDLLNVV